MPPRAAPPRSACGTARHGVPPRCARLAQYEDECAAEPVIRARPGRGDRGYQCGRSRRRTVTIDMRDGRSLSEYFRAGRETPQRPMSDAEVDAKMARVGGLGRAVR